MMKLGPVVVVGMPLCLVNNKQGVSYQSLAVDTNYSIVDQYYTIIDF